MSTTRAPVILGLLATALLFGGWFLLFGSGEESSTGQDNVGGILSPADREALAAPPVDPGPAPSGEDPSVDFSDPVSVATAYVVAGYSLTDSDAGHTNRRAIPYAAPNTPPNTVGVLVLAPPAKGHRLTARVTDVTQISGEPTDSRRGYLVGYQLTETPPSTAPEARRTRYLLLVRQFDGRWLVAGDSAEAPLGEP